MTPSTATRAARSDVTPWFPITVAPSRVGCYEILGHGELSYPFHWWDGRRWSNPNEKPTKGRGTRFSGPRNFYLGYHAMWRGLKEKA